MTGHYDGAGPETTCRPASSNVPPCPFEAGRTYDMVGGGTFHVYAIVRNSQGIWTIDGRATYENSDMGGVASRRLDGTLPGHVKEARGTLIAPVVPPVISEAAVAVYLDVCHRAQGRSPDIVRNGLAAAVKVMLAEGVVQIPANPVKT